MQIVDRVREVLRTKDGAVWALPSSATVFQALEVIAERDIGSVLVVDDGELKGIFSEREYARKIALAGRSSHDTTLEEVMFAPPPTVTPDTRIDEAMRMMADHRLRHLPVLNETGIVGVISMSDVMKWIMSVQQSTIEHLQGYITGQYCVALAG